MARRRIAHTLGAAAGGLLGAAFLPSGIAVADGTYDGYDLIGQNDFVVNAGGVRDFFVSVPPAAEGTVQGTQTFDWTGANSTSGSFDALVGNNTDLIGDTNQVIYVEPGTDPGGPGAGSIFDTFSYTNGFSTVYSDVVESDGSHDITYQWITPSGQVINIPTTYDAAALTALSQHEGLPDGYSYILSGDETHYGVSAILPAAADLQGYQNYLVDNAAGVQVGTFAADVTDTSDYLNNSSQALLVTASTGDGPAVGSVFNTFFAGPFQSVYSAIPNGDGTDTVTDTIVTPWGNINFPTDFDAAKGIPEILAGTSHLGQDISTNDFTIAATDAPSTITAVDGLPPEDVVIQGTQAFNYTDLSDGSNSGAFLANVTQSAIVFGDTTQDQYVVTQDLVAGQGPAVGSVFEVDNYGHGYELVYSDLVGAGTGDHNLITETLVTPFGDFNIPTTYDASSVLGSDSSQHFGSGMLAEVASLLGGSSTAGAESASSVDTSALAEMFPHLATALDGGSLADMFPNLATALDGGSLAEVFPNLATAFDAGAIADVFPHLEAGLNLLTSLF
jgi:hypothetical protein